MKGGKVNTFIEHTTFEECNYERTVFDKTASTSEECLKLAQNEPIFDGKTFWEAEADMEWVEW